MKIEETIQDISTIIANSNLIDSWGGWCINMTDKQLPYGIKPLGDPLCGNVYTLNDNFQCSGYLYISNITSSTNGGLRGSHNVTVSINLFNNPKKIGNLNTTFEIPLAIIGALRRKYKEITLTSSPNQKYSFQEISVINVTFKAYDNCDELALKNGIC